MEQGVDTWPAKMLSGEVCARSARTRAECLLDDGADVNVVSQSLALQCELERLDVPLPSMEGFLGEKAHCYGAYRLRLRLADSTGKERVTVGTFYGAELQSPQVILGRPWRRANGVVVNSGNDTWWYSEAGEMPAVRVLTAHEFQKVRRKCPKIFSLKAFEEGKVQLPEELKGYEDVILTGSAAQKPLPEGVEHAIELELGKKPPFRPLHHLSPKELEVLREYCETAMQNGWIQRSTSEAGANVLFAPKKDGSLRLCVDYRGLNSITVKDRHPLPLIAETLDRLGRAAVYSIVDLKDAYHRIPIKRGDEWKTAFRTRYGHYEYKVMPFGLTNAPATFQAYINRALAGLVDVCCVVYLDDILIYSDSHEQHVRHLHMVLDRLRKFALYANGKKCRFF